MELLEQISKVLFSNVSGSAPGPLDYITCVIRWILPFLAVIILLRCALSMLRGKPESEVWGWLSLPDGTRAPLCHWENIIGRSKTCDVAVDVPTVSRTHAAVIRDDKGNWRIINLGSKGGVMAGGKKVPVSALIHNGTVLKLADVELVFVALSPEQEREQAMRRSRPGRTYRPGATFLLLTMFQLLLALQFCISMKDDLNLIVPAAFLLLTVLMWLYFALIRSFGRLGFEAESIAFFLCTLSMSVVATSAPESLIKQLACLFAGLVGFVIIGCYLRDLKRTADVRWAAAIVGLLLLAVNVLTADTLNGAKNWLQIGGVSFQPSEFVKVCFVFAGAATMDRLYMRRNLLAFIAFSGACVLALVLMSDFGTAVVFFCTYLIISFLRSGSFATVFLSVGGAALAGMLALTMKPYIASRFSTWGHAWEYVNEGGYQQTRAMAASASGGLFGVGAGNGWFHRIFAADTDLVFGVICEELGLIIAVLAVLAIVLLAVFSVKSAATARSSFYVIASCAAVTIMMTQVILNVFGSLDILPFTGVTFPFVSNGGSSMIACWCLLAFIKANDTRQNASIAVRLPKGLRAAMQGVRG